MSKTDILNNGSRRETDEKSGGVRRTESRNEGERCCRRTSQGRANERARARKGSEG